VELSLFSLFNDLFVCVHVYVCGQDVLVVNVLKLPLFLIQSVKLKGYLMRLPGYSRLLFV